MRRNFFGKLITIYVISTFLFSFLAAGGTGGEGGAAQNIFAGGGSLSPADFGALCISSVYPEADVFVADSRDNEEQGADTLLSAQQEKKDEVAAKTVKKEEEKPKEPVVFGEDPAVLIIHTHATETYLPASGGNYHSKKKENSVRDVGQVLAESLEEEGISVVHDETLHDDPSYNSSYSRSYETVEKLLEKYPTIECVIDLHRDAIASETAGATISVEGKTCARYLYVVSTITPTYQSNSKFIEALNQVATDEFSGYTGNVLERGYQYNQNLCDKYLLLEFGNNRNDIEDVRNTAKIYGKILAKTMKAGN